MEDTELDLEEINDLPPEEKAQKLLEIAQQATAKAKQEEEMRKQLESAQEKWVQKLLDDKKYQDLMRSEAQKLKLDANYFADLLGKDETLAKAVLDEYFWGITVDDALAQVNPEIKKSLIEKKDEKDLDAKLEAKIVQKEVSKTVKEFVSKANLSKDEKEAFDKEFADITEWKSLNEANIEKYLRLALREALPENKDIKRIEREAFDMANSQWQAQSSKWWQVHEARTSNIEYLKKVGILK